LPEEFLQVVEESGIHARGALNRAKRRHEQL
jgi:hypothetical protein